MEVLEETDNKVKVLTVEQLELDCKICYSRFDTYSRRPKLLHCLHRVCSKCLNKLLQTDSDCLLITVLELPEDSSSSLSMLSAIYRPPDSTPCYVPKSHTWTSRSLPRCLLGALCMVYFSSLPLGIYLLMIGRLWMGVVLVSLVPLTLLALVLYGFCQCLIQEGLDALHALQHGRHTSP